MLPRIGIRAYALTIIIGCMYPAAPAMAFDAPKADRSVVRIVNFEFKDGKRTGAGVIGTGFVVDAGYIVTNHHVIDDANWKKNGSTGDRVVVDGSVKKLLPSKLIWASKELDLAVLRVEGFQRPTVTLSTVLPATHPNKGDVVWAIGYPGMADGLGTDESRSSSTVTKGVVAKVVPGTAGHGDKVRSIIQHNASIHGGNSGGPLFDNCGNVIGVNTYSANSTIEREGKGKDVASIEANTGVFYSPHIVNFIEAHKTVAELKVISLNTTATPCDNPTDGAGAMSVWVYGLIGLVALLALGATVLALRKGTTREVVRMVESYSAYVKRKGKPPSDESMQPRKVSSPPDFSMSGSQGPAAAAAGAAPATAKAKAATGGWKLDGKGSKGQAVRLSISAADMERAMAKKEAGIILGRSGTLADIVIEDETVSRRHAKLYLAEAGLALEDLKSAYGTEVNGHKVEAFQPVEIKPGDRLKLGGVELAFASAK